MEGELSHDAPSINSMSPFPPNLKCKQERTKVQVVTDAGVFGSVTPCVAAQRRKCRLPLFKRNIICQNIITLLRCCRNSHKV